MANRKKGFTLVELLIVIVVIGVLSAMMMLSSTEAVSSAKAANIINNLRNWKTATLEWYADNLDRVTEKGQIREATSLATGDAKYGDFATNIKASDIVPYVGSNFKSIDDKGNAWDSTNGRFYTDHVKRKNSSNIDCNVWLIAYQMPTNDAVLKEKLKARAKTAGLLWKSGNDTGTYDAEQVKNIGGGGSDSVWIEVMDFSK